YIPPQDLPTIKAYAGKDRTMIAGALADFNGQAFGLDDKPLENARYLWNFGDGVIKEGENITHFYKYPGEYKVILEVSSGGYSVSDDVIVKVVSNEIFISEIKTGVDSFIELANPSGQEINISGWAFRNGNQSFTFSKNSFIRPRGYLVIPASASGIIFYQGNGRVELLYPGGFLADSFNYSGVVLDNQSFSRNGDGGAITPETPGAVNAKMAVLTVSAPEKISKKESELDLCPDGSVCEVKPDEKTSGQNQVANVVAVSNNNSSSNNKIYYFLGVFVLVIFSGGGIYFIRRQS
ncbi:lamin tail domain-containing protein, partial [Patescibacteria group bacterium]|nr:lamin tail domain-containing protein [Patescibacteria group bacterium]